MGLTHQALLRSLFVVFPPPGLNYYLCVRQAGEPVFVQAFITEAPVKRFDVGILMGLTWLNQEQLYTSLMSPGQHGPTTELFAIFRADGFGQPA